MIRVILTRTEVEALRRHARGERVNADHLNAAAVVLDEALAVADRVGQVEAALDEIGTPERDEGEREVLLTGWEAMGVQANLLDPGLAIAVASRRYADSASDKIARAFLDLGDGDDDAT